MRGLAIILLVLLALGSSARAFQAPSGDRVAVPQPTEQAVRYHRSGNVLWVVRQVWALAVPAAILFTGLSARMRDWARAIGRWWVLAVAVYFVIYSVLTFLIDLPLDYYTGFARQHAYGLSHQSLGKWLGDAGKGLALSTAVGALLLWVPYLLLRRSPKRWWLYTTLLSMPFLMFVLLVEPVWVAPLYNDFGPMKDKILEAKILALAERAGIEGGRVYEVNKSADTETVNAYVTGLGNTKRIVLWDTIIAKLDEGELLFVMGHEMGHYVLHHVLVGLLLAPLGILVTLYLIHRTAGALIGRFKTRFRFTELSDVASLPLLILLANAYGLLLDPVANAVIRRAEHEADRFGLEITRDNHDAAMAFVRLQQENLGYPRPGLLYKLWRSTHPPLGERIDFCNEYRPWETGGEMKYGERFKRRDS